MPLRTNTYKEAETCRARETETNINAYTGCTIYRRHEPSYY